MAVGTGVLAVAGARIESDQGLISGAYPTTEATADAEEVKIKHYDQIPLLSESIDDGHQWQNDETIIGGASIVSSERVGKLPSGTLTLQGMYDGLDAIFACALGGEDWTSPDWTVGSQKTETNCSIDATGKMGTMATLNIDTTDDDRFIKFDFSGSIDSDAGQVRHISGVNAGSDYVTWENALSVGNHGSAGIVIADEFQHTFEPTNNLHDQAWTDIYSDYPAGTGVYNANDQMFRRLTLAIAKSVSLWVYRSVMINSLTIKGEAKGGVTLELDLIPFDRVTDSLSGSRQDGSTVDGWKANLDWHPGGSDYGVGINERIMFSDLTFRIGNYSTSTALDSSDDLGISAFEITIANNLKTDDQDSVSGVYRKQPVRNGFLEVTGSLTMPRYIADTLISKMENDTMLMAHWNFQGTTMSTISRALQIWLPSLKITGHSESVSGSGIVSQTVNFQAFVPSGQAADFPTYGITDPNPCIQIQTTNHNPFNLFHDENQEY